MKKILIGLALISLLLVVGCNTSADECRVDRCYMRGRMSGSIVEIRSHTDGICQFPFNYNVTHSDNLRIEIQEEPCDYVPDYAYE